MSNGLRLPYACCTEKKESAQLQPGTSRVTNVGECKRKACATNSAVPATPYQNTKNPRVRQPYLCTFLSYRFAQAWPAAGHEHVACARALRSICRGATCSCDCTTLATHSIELFFHAMASPFHSFVTTVLLSRPKGSRVPFRRNRMHGHRGACDCAVFHAAVSPGRPVGGIRTVQRVKATTCATARR